MVAGTTNSRSTSEANFEIPFGVVPNAADTVSTTICAKATSEFFI